MMMHVDTQKLHTTLAKGGFSEQQADTIVDTVRTIDFSHLATKQDIEELRTATKWDIKDLRVETKQDLEREISGLRNEMHQGFTQMRGEITLLKWMMGMILAGVISLVIKGFFPV